MPSTTLAPATSVRGAINKSQSLPASGNNSSGLALISLCLTLTGAYLVSRRRIQD
jgi:LPXTG-motif cell wall-anchored protein